MLPPDLSSPESINDRRFGSFEEELLGEYEFLQSAVSAWLGHYPFMGDFSWRWFGWPKRQLNDRPRRLLEELKSQGQDQRYLAAGLFDGDPVVLERVIGEMEMLFARLMP